MEELPPIFALPKLCWSSPHGSPAEIHQLLRRQFLEKYAVTIVLNYGILDTDKR
jgi:hypothetical protein